MDVVNNFSGVVLSHTKGFCLVLDENQRKITCHEKGSLFESHLDARQIAVGDKVLFSQKGDEPGLITKIFPATSQFIRLTDYNFKPQIMASNIDLLAITLSLDSSDIKWNFLVRLLVAAYTGAIKPFLILTKADLKNSQELSKIRSELSKIELDFQISSIFDTHLVLPILDNFHSKKVLLFGQSGVGKSSLLNHLFGELNLQTSQVNSKTKKGKHTTTLALAYMPTPDYFLIDTPGVKRFRPYIKDISKLGQIFEAFNQFRFQCPLKNCVHISEPICAVKEAVKSGTLSAALYNGYSSFYHEEAQEQKNTKNQRSRIKK